jgi:hypothetical protein
MSISLGGNEITGNDQFLLNNTSTNNGNLFVFTNESDDNNNLLINFNSNYDFGFNNNDIILSEHNNHHNYYLKINSSNILLNNTNISNIFTSNYIIQDNLGNKIIEIDNNNNNTIFNNNNVTFNIKEKNFTIKNDDINIINISNDIQFNCNLYIDTIYCRNINPYDKKGFVDVDNLQITSAKTFSNIDLIYTNNDAKLTMISDINKDIYDILVINNDLDNSNIFSINNKGFINYREKSSNSFININNINNETELYNIISYQGDFDTDKFNIDKYSHINIGSNINLNNDKGALFTINRNDERKNLDETNSQNVNRDKSLLDLNIFYESSNNYEWFINSNADSTISELFDNNIFTENFEDTGGEIDINLSDFENLFDNYLNLHQRGDKGMYYLDIVSSNNIIDYDTSNYYYFLTTEDINSEIDYDYTKLKLNDFDYNVSGNKSIILNKKYNENNLLNNSNQVYYEYKVYSWSYNTKISDKNNYYIIYPAYLKNINNSNLKLECNIENIQYTNNESAAKQLYFSISIDKDIDYTDDDLTDAIDIDNSKKNDLSDGINKFIQNTNLVEYITSNTDFTTYPNIITLRETDEIIQYCKDYANITLPFFFTIHISKEIYNYIRLSDYKIVYNYYYPRVINKPNFINFTNNDNVITTINNNGSLQFGHYDNTTHTDININEYSIISPNNKILTSNIKTDIITSYNNDSVSFDNKKIININSLNFSGEGSNLLNVGNISVKKIISTDSNIYIYNSLFDYTIDDNNLILSSNKFNNQHYNSIINIDSSYDTDIKPAISISGNEPSFIQKNSNYIYQTIIKNKKFRKDFDYTEYDTKTCYEINYSNLINKNFEYKDNTFNNFNSTHILQHIIEDDIISLGENYNLCFYNGFFTSNSSKYSELLSQNTSNSSFSMSLGVPYKNDKISDNETGSYYYNYIHYFNNYIKNNNYMLNIFGNTKISGIDGDTNALNVVIQEESNIDGIFFTNIGIGKEPRNETNKNILDIDGDIYTSNIYINDTNISNYLEINVPVIIHKTNINASNINDGIIDLQHIPDIPSLKLEPPSSRPFIYEPNTNYIHPLIGNNNINTINNAIYDTDTEYFYNIFESSSNIKIENSIIADILLIGGGGSANNDKGGIGGDVILLNNIDIINNSTITFVIGQGATIDGSTINGSETIITIKNDDIQKNITFKAYGGNGGINQGNGNNINPILANNIYSYFSVYSENFGELIGGDKLYFGGNGNGNHSDYLLSLSHGKKGSGGYYGTYDYDKNGINGAIFIRYKFEETFIETYDTVYDTLGLLQYNWNNNSWSLNYDNFNHCNILFNKITDTSNILFDTINNTSNNIIQEIHINSNLLIQETNNISNYIDNINNIIDNNSNYSYENISNLYHINDDIFHTNSNYIIKNEKIPLINIDKLNHVKDYYLYNPIVNNEIVNTTSNYKMINSSNYIFLEHDDNIAMAHVTYNINFQNNDEVDILLVGGGGKGGEGGGFQQHNGGGGGAIIEIKNLSVYTGDRFIIKVGKGGGKNTGSGVSLFGQDTILQYNDYTLTAKGGQGNDSGTQTGSGGQFTIPVDFIHPNIEGRKGGNGGVAGEVNVAQDGFVSDILGSNYYWGGGGGTGIWPITEVNEEESYGGIGGGGGGAFYLSKNYNSIYFTSQGGKETYFNDTNSDIDNDVTTSTGNNDKIINGAHGIDGTGGGGGGSIHISPDNGYSDYNITGEGGNGGNGIAIIKFKNRYNNNVLVRNAYLYYNYDKTKWEVQSLNSLNLDINIQDINIQQLSSNIDNIYTYIDAKIIPLPGSNIPLASISGFNIADRSIGHENIFGYMGRASNITTEDTDLVEHENGLITIPEEGYNDPDNPYYKRLINGSKLQDNSITNDNLVNNTITREKIKGKIHGSKLSNLSIDYNDIIDINSINSKVFLTNNLDCNIYFSNFSNISLDLSYFNIYDTRNNDSYSINITNTTDIEIPINTFSNIRINYSDLNTSCNYDGILNLYSLNNDIDINRFSNVNVNISNLHGYGQDDFIISNINLYGVVPQNYIDNIYVNVDSLDSSSLDNANVYLLSDNRIIDNNIITHFNITYNQLQNVNISNVTITNNQELINNTNIHGSFINIDDIDYDINKFSNVSVIFKEGSNINSSNIHNSFINIDNIDYNISKFSNINVIFKEGSNINSSNINYSFINIDNIDYDINKFSNVSIIFKEGYNIDSSNILNSFINNANINYENNLLSNVVINFDLNQKIDASNIDKVNINYDNIFFDDFNKLNNITIIFDQNINASNINSSTINNSNIYYDDYNKLSNVIIEGNINSSNITNAILKDTANIVGNTNFNVTVNGKINSSNISRATLEDTCTIVGTDKINDVFINCDIHSSNIGLDAILSQRSIIIGDEKISNITITGEIPTNIINNATINLDDNTTRFSQDSKIEGLVTITGIIYSSNFDFATYSNQISFDLITGDNTLNGNILADESIDSKKLASNLDLFVDSITFDDGNMITNFNDYYTSNQINNNFVSKDYYINKLANNILSNSNININLYNENDNTYSNFKAPFILNDNYIFIDSASNIYTNEDYALLNIYDKNKSANIYIYSKNNSLYEYDNIDRTSTDYGSMIKFNNPLLSINLQNLNVMEFNINSNISYNDFKLNGNIIFSDNTTIRSGVFNSLYNGVTQQLIMNNTVNGIHYSDSGGLSTGQGFIHCNGLHAMFDITAFSTTTSSDKRLKKDIKELTYDNEILKLNPVSFKWNDKNKSNSSNVGFIAQEIEEILPILVKDGPDDYKTVNYTGLIPYLVKHIQILEERIKILENK